MGIQGAHITMAHVALLDPGDVLLDNCSSVSICRNKELVKDLKMDNRGIHVLTNGGSIHCDVYGSSTLLPKLTKVWFNEESMVNILSLSEVKKKYRVKMDSNGKDVFIVFAENGKQLKFREKNGLYVLSKDKVERILLTNFFNGRREQGQFFPR